MGRVILIASGKGGVGKTTIATNLGVALAKKRARTLVLDMNVGLRNDDIYLGLEDSILFDFGDVLSGMCKIDKAMVKSEYLRDLYHLACPQNREIDGLCASHIRTMYSKLKREFDVVLVDCPIATGLQLANLSSGADEAIIVVSQDYISLRNGDATNKKLKLFGVFHRYHIVNQIAQEVYNSDRLPDLMEIAKSLEVPCLGAIPYDVDIHIANNAGLPVALNEGSYLAKTFDDIATRILE